MSEQVDTKSPVFGVPDYTVRPEPSVGGMVLLRPDGSSVCVFEGSMPEAAVKRVAMQDQKVQGLWRESLSYLLVDLEKYVDYQAALQAELAALRHLVHGGAVAEEFGASRRGQRGRR